MSDRSSLPYKPTNPRTVRSAERRGWHVVDVGRSSTKVIDGKEKITSWTGLCIWADCYSQSYWVGSYSTGKFAFENYADASMFIFQWTLK